MRLRSGRRAWRLESRPSPVESSLQKNERKRGERMAEAARVDPEEVLEKIESGEALLVCAYEDVAKCRDADLEGSITLGELRSRLASIPKDKEIVFFCA